MFDYNVAVKNFNANLSDRGSSVATKVAEYYSRVSRTKNKVNVQSLAKLAGVPYYDAYDVVKAMAAAGLVTLVRGRRGLQSRFYVNEGVSLPTFFTQLTNAYADLPVVTRQSQVGDTGKTTNVDTTAVKTALNMVVNGLGDLAEHLEFLNQALASRGLNVAFKLASVSA
jgi:hypothetical protein